MNGTALRRASLWFVVALLAWPAALAAAPHTNYAILFSGGGNPANNHKRYYDETLRMWEITTKKLGFPLANVYVLFADGTDPGLDRTFGDEIDKTGLTWVDSDWTDITTAGGIIRPGRAINIEQTMNEVAGRITSNDSFYFWAFNHGSNPAFDECPNQKKAPNDPNTGSQPNAFEPGACVNAIPGWNVNDVSLVMWDPPLFMTDATFAALADLISFKQPLAEAYAFAECFGAGMADNLFPHPRRFAAWGAAANECSLGKAWAVSWATALEFGVDTGMTATHDLGFFAEVGDQKGGGPGLDKETPGFMGFNHDIITNQAVPEPSTLVLVAAGILALGVARRRRRARP